MRAALLAGIWLMLALPAGAVGQEMTPAPPPVIEELGEGLYRIGSITVDKPARRFTVPGRVIHLDDTLEYIAVTRGGMKEYESLLELDVTGSEFQLACILVGLDDAQSVKPRYQFDEREAVGQSVELTISFEKGGERRTVRAANALLEGEEPFDDHGWVYIGSVTQENGEFMADMIGTLIGFVHDPFAIIEHGRGAGIGAYGLITGNAELLPPEGAPVTLGVEVVNESGGEENKKRGE